MKPRLIAFCGRASSGKTTAAWYICRRLWEVPTYWSKVYSFATRLKILVQKQYGFSDAQIYGTQAEKEAVDPRCNTSPRKAAQDLGTNMREVFGENIWVDTCLDSINRDLVDIREKQVILLIDDLRYKNEAELIYNNSNFDAKIIKLVCPDPSLSAAEFSSHASETEVDEIPSKYIYSTITSHRSDNSSDLKQKLDELLVRLGLLPHTNP